MNKLLIALLALAITGCTTVKTFNSAPQNYRLKGTEKTLNITGDLKQTFKQNPIVSTAESELKIYFDGKLTITGFLDSSYGGEFKGIPYDDKATAASCNTKRVAENTGETRCIVFVDNERTVTLQF
ncbi:MAG: hypothetical protein V4605_08900 [Pseudomonadota bacterium]